MNPDDATTIERPTPAPLPVVRVSPALLDELLDGLAADMENAPQDMSLRAVVARDVLDFVLQNLPTPAPWATPTVRLLPFTIEPDTTPALMMGVKLSGFLQVPTLTAFLNRDLPPEAFVRTALHEALHVVEALRCKALEVALMEVSTRTSISTASRDSTRPSWLAVLDDASARLFGVPLRDDVPLDRWPLGHGGDAYVAKLAARLA